MDRIGDDMRDVLVGQRVHGLAAAALHPHQARPAQHPQVLGHQRLAHAETINKLVHEAWLLCQLRDDRQPRWSGQHLEQFPGRLESSRLR